MHLEAGWDNHQRIAAFSPWRKIVQVPLDLYYLSFGILLEQISPSK
jgi:hypothetical protein